MFVTRSSLNKSYARSYTLPPDHISPRKQEERVLPQPLSNFWSLFLKWSSLQKSLFMFLSCISTSEASSKEDACSGHTSYLRVPSSTSVPFPHSSLLVSLISNCLPHFSFSTLLPPTHCHIIYLLFLHLGSCHTSCLRPPPSPVSLSR